MGDVGERSGVDEDGSSLQSLHQVGLDGILHENGERSSNSDVVGGDGDSGLAGTDDHASETKCTARIGAQQTWRSRFTVRQDLPLLHILEIGSKSQDSHALRGYGNVEAGVPGEALLGGCLANSDFAEVSVVDVKYALPGKM